MLRPRSPIFFLFALILSTASFGSAGRPADPPSPDASAPAAQAEDTMPAEPLAASPEAEAPLPDSPSLDAPAEPMDDTGFSSADVALEEGSRVCTEYGKTCQRSRQCCAPLHCGFDGYAYYCRY